MRLFVMRAAAASLLMAAPAAAMPGFDKLQISLEGMEMYEGLPPEVREKLDPPPTRGDLQLDEVQESEFFFA